MAAYNAFTDAEMRELGRVIRQACEEAKAAPGGDQTLVYSGVMQAMFTNLMSDLPAFALECAKRHADNLDKQRRADFTRALNEHSEIISELDSIIQALERKAA